MTEEQKQYYEKELASIRRGGDLHQPWLQTYIAGLGSAFLGPVDPPVVGLCGGDPYFSQYFQNWTEVNAFIKELKDEAIKAWGEQK